MRLCSIASGSSGNCIYAGTDTTHVLVDAGISGKRVENGLNDIGLTGRDIDAILITHEHIDHIAGLGVLSRRYGIPIYTTEKTADAIQETKSVGKIPEELFHPVCAEEAFTIKDLTVNPMRISHDAADPVGYRFSYGSSHAAVCTDLGTYNDYTVECLKGMDVSIALCSCSPQSQRLELNISPVAQEECTRTRIGSSNSQVPLNKATCSKPFDFWRKGIKRK